MFALKLLLLLWLLFVASVVVAVVVVANRRLPGIALAKVCFTFCFVSRSVAHRGGKTEKGKIENAHNLAVKDFNHES